MIEPGKLLIVAMALAALAVPAAADTPASGREVFERRCQTCHGGTGPADTPLGPSLAGVIGAKAGTRPSGIHSRALEESGVVWNRDSLRRFLAAPQGTMPGTLMPVRVNDPDELESLLDYMESLR
jgi:cytochrome c2